MAQLASFAALPLLSRLFTPADFGVFGLFSSVFSIFAVVACWRIDLLVPSETEEFRAKQLVLKGLFVTFAISCLVGSFLLIAPKIYYLNRMLTNLGYLIWALPLAVFLSGTQQLLQSWFIRHQHVEKVSLSRLTQGLLRPLFSIGAGVAGWGAAGMVVAFVGAICMSIVPLFPSKSTIKCFSLEKKLLSLTDKERSQTSAAATIALFNAFSLNATMLLIGLLYAPDLVGHYSLALSLTSVPVGVVAQGFSQNFWSESASLARGGSLGAVKKLYLTTTGYLLIVAVAFSVCVLTFAQYIPLLLGSQSWSGVDTVAIAVLPACIGTILFSPTNHLFLLGKQHLQILADLLRLVLIALSIALSKSFDLPLVSCVALIAAASLVGHLALFLIHIICHRQLD